LIAAGAPEEKTRDAAEEIAAYENRLNKPRALTEGQLISR
jgi:hypothetical protein